MEKVPIEQTRSVWKLNQLDHLINLKLAISQAAAISSLFKPEFTWVRPTVNTFELLLHITLKPPLGTCDSIQIGALLFQVNEDTKTFTYMGNRAEPYNAVVSSILFSDGTDFLEVISGMVLRDIFPKSEEEVESHEGN